MLMENQLSQQKQASFGLFPYLREAAERKPAFLGVCDRSGSGNRDRLAVHSMPQSLVQTVVDRLGKEVDRPVTKDEIGSTGVTRLISEGRAPVARSPAITDSTIKLAAGIIVDGNARGRHAVLAV